jgi:hypothetical protein
LHHLKVKPTLNVMYYLKEQNKKLFSSNVKVVDDATTGNGGLINDGDLQLVCEITG